MKTLLPTSVERARGVAPRRLRISFSRCCDERDRGEDAQLHERHRQDAGHEVGGAGQVLGLQRLGSTASAGGLPLERLVHAAHDLGDDLPRHCRSPSTCWGRCTASAGTARSAPPAGPPRPPPEPGGHDDHRVELAVAHRCQAVVLAARPSSVKQPDAGEALAQAGRRRRSVLVDPADRVAWSAAAGEDRAEQDDEDDREGERPEQRRPVAVVALDVGDRERQQAAPKRLIVPRLSRAAPGRSARGRRPRAWAGGRSDPDRSRPALQQRRAGRRSWPARPACTGHARRPRARRASRPQRARRPSSQRRPRVEAHGALLEVAR